MHFEKNNTVCKSFPGRLTVENKTSLWKTRLKMLKNRGFNGFSTGIAGTISTKWEHFFDKGGQLWVE